MLNKQNSGYVIIISVLIVGAVGLVITTVLALLANDFYQTSFILEQSNQDKAITNACAEVALQNIYDDNYFFGTGSISLGNGSCDYYVIDTGGETREVQVEGTVDNVTRRVKINISNINPNIIIDSWQEVADF